jgi:hypothetical protein
MARQASNSWYGSAKALVGTVIGAVVVLALAGSASAAESARWAVTVVPTPTNIAPETPRSEVDRLTVDATGGTYVIEIGGGTKKATGPLAYNATAAEVQAALNAALTFGVSTTVSGEGPGGTAPYTITWGGSAENNNLEYVSIENVQAQSESLTGGSHTATITPIATGRSAPDLIVTATNVGGAPTDGSVVTLSDVLPAGFTATEISGQDVYTDWENFLGLVECTPSPIPSCAYNGSVGPGDSIVVKIKLSTAGGLPASVNDTVNLSGGGVGTTEVQRPVTVSETQAPFGISPSSVVAETSSRQAGSHSDVTTSFAFTTKEPYVMSASPKDVRFDLPRGLVGNTVGMPRCTMSAVLKEGITPHPCPRDTIVGMATVTVGLSAGNATPFVAPIYNIAPAPGEPAAFGFNAILVPARLDTTVLSNGSYGVRVTAPDINEAAAVYATTITIWGVPADHNGEGPDISIYNLFYGEGSFGGPNGGVRVPLLTNPQQCSEPLSAMLDTDSWIDHGHFVSSETVSPDTPTGCDQLRLSSSFSMVPDTLEAGAPAGYHFDLNVPQNSTPDGLGTPNVKDVSLKLPLGTVVNPSAAWGLKACSNGQFYGPNYPSQEPAAKAACPREAQVGTVAIKTPALEEALEGQVFLAEPECNPCTPTDAEDGKMVRLFVQAVSEGEGGIVVKLEGHAMIDQATGQITTVFKNNPQLPFDEFKLKLAGGPRAVLANPRSCGSVSSNLDLSAWSSPFTPDVTPSYSFEINQNCFGPQFNPSFVAGMPNVQAGGFGGFTLAFGRSDNDQFVSQLTTSMPAGLLGKIAGIPLCKEAQAVAGSCDAASQIGTVEALTGPGATPFLVSGGHVFLTEGYGGAPYGLSIVVPAVAGPYTLSGTNGTGSVVVRAQIFVDQHSAQLTVVSGQLPSMLDGIPLQLKAVNVRIDRPGFTFNPTSCAKKSIVGKLSAVEGLSSTVTDSFQVTNCASLVFKPGFKVSATGKTSRAKGAGLDVKLSYPTGSFGKAANIRSVKVNLPKQLPSRLTTLQKACPDSVFNQNPASCPAASRVGAATATTPILADTLTGPAFFVSHGGAKFPELVIVLSGDGVTVQLDGETFISKAGITSSTFRSIPDVPVSTFDLNLPQGSNSALAANGNLCTANLKMPTAFTAQNGLVIHQTTRVTATGCPKHKAKKAKKGKQARIARERHEEQIAEFQHGSP